MGWERYFKRDMFTAAESSKLDDRLVARDRPTRNRALATDARVRKLEADLGRAALLVRALTELCIEKGVLTRDQLKQRMFAVDLDDGVADQRLDPKLVVPGGTAPKAPERRGPRPPPRKRS